MIVIYRGHFKNQNSNYHSIFWLITAAYISSLVQMGNLSCSDGVCIDDLKGDEDSGWLFSVLNFCDRNTRANCIFLSKRHCKILTTDASFHWRLEQLHIEHGLYFPAQLPKGKTWRSMYIELDKKRHLWEAEYPGQAESAKLEYEKYRISVYARFKPLGIDSNRARSGRKAVLPLHQRLELIKINNGIESIKDALCVLKEQGAWFKEKWEKLDQSTSPDEVTNSDSRENASDLLTSGIKLVDSRNSRVVVVDATKGLREFAFDSVLDDKTPQVDVYEQTTRGLVCDIVNGVSATCLVYGQTSSGKTHTMFGTTEKDSNTAGIIPRACSELMNILERRKGTINLNLQCSVSVSFVEIYGNDILDLLKQGEKCSKSKVSAQRSVLDGSAEVLVENVDDVMKLLWRGEAQRRKAATAMNSRSSRAHSVFIVSLNQKCLNSNKSIKSRLFLADLGGCEQTKKSQLEAGRSDHIEAIKERNRNKQMESKDEPEFSTGFVKSDRMREAVYINLGLMSLKSCVEALNRGEHVPYASSKLTMLLASGLGGNGKTAVIVCASQDEEHASETINAFKFGQACRTVSNSVRTQADMLGDLMKELDREIEECEDRIKRNEKWVVKEEKIADGLAERGTLEADGFGGIEVKKTTILVGAEEDRKLLNSLLMKKSQLSGSSIDVTKGNIGFGNAHEYGLGQKFSSSSEEKNYRFAEIPSDDLVPDTVKSRKNGLVKNAAYSGISS
mmetsp:Transcript_4843/g.9815  ORF Transcript_4843/g.9815 Transcript_4843/m.9815 type:complete len:731 (+) Transcript_4843:4365-6557(+)